MTGYSHAGYAQSLSEFGAPRPLPRAGGWLLERPIPNSDARDAMGCYPLFACRSWGRLHEDLTELGDELVSLTLVTDPFGDHDAEQLGRCFPDLVVPFKEHFVVDLERPLAETVSRHHRRYARRALAQVDVEVCTDPPGFLDDWMHLHAHLLERHQISGLRAFSRSAFAKQLALPGMVVLRGGHAGEPIGAQLWLLEGEVAYGHVLAFSEAGYRLGAPYALYWAALEHFVTRVRFCDLGAAPGAAGDGSEGLLRFKRGWASGTRTAYLCGRIFDRPRYESLCRSTQAPASGYFPAYRAGELTPRKVSGTASRAHGVAVGRTTLAS